jgi:hypothetical protein
MENVAGDENKEMAVALILLRDVTFSWKYQDYGAV